MKKRWMVLGLLLVVLGTAAVFLSWNRGDVRHVQRFVGDSLVYTEEEVRDAMDVTEEYFRKYFVGCKLLELTYDAKWRLQEEEWAESYGVDQVIVLTSSFYVKPNGGDGSLNQDDTYTGWQWILARNGDGKWEHRDHGY